jgi:DNA-binding transcriptional MerR regulator
MDKIGIIAARSGLSVRTLRYWEQVGILKSIRGENGYRYYDNESLTRIERIALLKRWEIPLLDIERILVEDDSKETIKTLAAHRQNIRSRGHRLAAIARELDTVLTLLNGASQERDVYALLGQTATLPKIPSSQGELVMENKTPLRIVKLPRLTVATVNHDGEGCEDACWNDILPFIKEHKLDEDRGYVYEQWITIPEDLILPEKFVKRHYQGGLHASLSCSLADIGEVWKELYNRLENDPVYLHDSGDERGDLCLEECPDYEGFLAPDVPLTSRRLDLLVAVKMRP